MVWGCLLLLTKKCSDHILKEGIGPGKILTILTSCHLDLLKVLVWTSSFSLVCIWSGWKYHETACGIESKVRRLPCWGGSGFNSEPTSWGPFWIVWLWVDESPGVRNSRGNGHSLSVFLSLVHFWLNLFDKYFLKYLPGTVQSTGDTQDGHSSCHPKSYKTSRGDSPVSRQLMTISWGKHREYWDPTEKVIQPVLVHQSGRPGSN